MTVDLLLDLGLLGQERVVVGVRLGELPRDLVEAVEQVALLADAVLDVAADVLVAVEVGLLGEQAYCGSGVSSALPLDVSSSPAMIRRSVDFPAPFGPRTPIFAPGRNAQRDVVEHLAPGP